MAQRKQTDKEKKTKKTRKKTVRKLSDIVKPEHMTVEEWQVALRQQSARDESFVIHAVDERVAPGEYSVKNPATRQTYKVVYRGEKSPWNYCSCLDFKTSQLGTCKHIEATKMWLAGSTRHHVHRSVPAYTSVYLSYKEGRAVRIRIGADQEEAFRELARGYFDEAGYLLPNAYRSFPRFLEQARAISDTFRCYHDALDFVLEMREADTRSDIVEGLSDTVLDSLLSVKLFPYQKEGVRFAVGKGRVLIADEMGLGKTIQAIATAEVFRANRLVDEVLVVCPTSLKYQWKREIERFAGSDVLVIEGNAVKRKQLYQQYASYKVVSYNAMSNDVKYLGKLETDMVIMDEVQRLKNWNTQIAIAARRIDARYAVALSGTPLENKLEELFSVMELVDQYCLGPYYKFRQECIVTNETGKVLGYKNLNAVGELARERLIRRRKHDVELQLPARQDKNLFVPMTQQQMDIHEESAALVARLIHKWNTHHFLSESDRRKLLLNLNIMRMVCDSTYILDQKTRYDVKIGETMNIIGDILQGTDCKVVVFSQWERMTRLLAMELEKIDVDYEYLHGGVPSVKRGEMTRRFQDNVDCRVFISTDAGSTGLNLQTASIIINLDLPWNPAVLEQRIGRIYRLGQQRNIQVINLVATGTIEERMIGKLRFKQNMFEGVLDNGDDSIFVSDDKFKDIVNLFGGIIEKEEDEEETAIIDAGEMEQAADEQPEQEEPEQEEPTETSADKENKPHGDESSEASRGGSSQDNDESSHDESSLDVSTHDRSSHDESSREESSHDGSSHDGSSLGDSNEPVSSPEDADSPEALVAQGVKFFSGMAKALQSPEATHRLVDSIVKTDEVTGKTHINIPVESKESVLQVLSVISKLFIK